MDTYRYFVVGVVGQLSRFNVGMLSCFGSFSDVVEHEFSSICELLGIGEYCYE